MDSSWLLWGTRALRDLRSLVLGVVVLLACLLVLLILGMGRDETII